MLELSSLDDSGGRYESALALRRKDLFRRHLFYRHQGIVLKKPDCYIRTVNSLECADQSALWLVATNRGHHSHQSTNELRRQAAEGQSGEVTALQGVDAS